MWINHAEVYACLSVKTTRKQITGRFAQVEGGEGVSSDEDSAKEFEMQSAKKSKVVKMKYFKKEEIKKMQEANENQIIF